SIMTLFFLNSPTCSPSYPLSLHDALPISAPLHFCVRVGSHFCLLLTPHRPVLPALYHTHILQAQLLVCQSGKLFCQQSLVPVTPAGIGTDHPHQLLDQAEVEEWPGRFHLLRPALWNR